ncbi:MAG: DNA topoisomerase VI subunit B [Candidatus Altiarchaeota archaeon]|nr:DNA topoisomerase VI subunit B [Candidatus Altiarchaeota archaeon]
MDVGEEFNRKFREVGVAEFFRKNLQMLGYSGAIRSFTTIIHEFVTNALDACEEYGILPEIKIHIKDLGTKNLSKGNIKLKKLEERLEDAEANGSKAKVDKLKRQLEKLENEVGDAGGHFVVTIEDNGPGIPLEYVPKVFGSMLSGTKFHRYVQSRGQQGIGAVGAVLYSQMTTGKPTKIVTSTGKGKASVVFLRVDVERNRAKIIEESVIDSKDWQGTKIVAEFKGLLYRRGEQSPYEYLRRTAMANPHATITLYEPSKKRISWKRTSNISPPLPKEMKPHPLGLSADDLLAFGRKSRAKKLSGFLQADLSRVSSNKSKEVLKISKVEDKEPSKINHVEADRIIRAFRDMKLLSPSTEGMTPIEEKHLEKSLNKRLEAKFIKANTRRPSVYRGGIPFQVEVSVAYGGGAGRPTSDGRKMEIMRFANKSPLLFDTGACGISNAIRSVNWKNYNVSDFENAPLTVFVNLISPHIPYTSAGKQAVADDDDVVKEIRFAVMEAGRTLKRYISGMHREALKVKRRSMFLKYAPEVAGALGKISHKNPEGIENMLIGMIEKRIKLREDKEAIEELTKNGTTEKAAA